ncbi:MAG: calcium-binding protein, partial [Cyanobium sp. LacPavin_0920_WC12_MAG_62_9]|nr:calcium-binding protein [Cyanobium sp. LacPavin_0920_WC12_MAG_62_9]
GSSQTQIMEHVGVERFQLTGGAGNDELFGALLDDTLTGSAGADLLTGGGGTDVFRFSQLSDSTRSSMDRIVDYHSDDAIVAPITAATTISSATAVISDAALANNEALNIALGGTSLLAGSVHALQLGADTLLVINDSIAGYQFSTDCMIRLENFSVSTATPISLQVA